MAMSVSSLKNRIEINLKAEFGDPEDAVQLSKFANAIATSVYNEIVQNADIELEASDISVPATGILDGTSTSCTGTAVNSAASLSQRIK